MRIRGWRTLVDWVATICVALAVVLVFEAEVAKPYRIPSSSMEPTLHCAKPGAWCRGGSSDRVVVNRLAYRFEPPKRGQIGSTSHGIAEPIYFFVFTQFRTENRFALFLELLWSCRHQSMICTTRWVRGSTMT